MEKCVILLRYEMPRFNSYIIIKIKIYKFFFLHNSIKLQERYYFSFSLYQLLNKRYTLRLWLKLY